MSIKTAILTLSITAIISLLLLLGLVTIPISVEPYDNTRVILEHTYQTYIAPPCYQQAEKTNFISEVTLKEALEMNYEPESSCTEQALKKKNKILIYFIAEKLSLKESEWDW